MSDTVLWGDHQVVPFRSEPPVLEVPTGRLLVSQSDDVARTRHRADREFARVRGVALVVAGASRDWDLLLATGRLGRARAAAGIRG
ncbi:MAG: hypothetical protein AMXMBFR64_35930 [Myxococcales bacterium]